MKYRSLQSRGSEYLFFAGGNWIARKAILIKAWSKNTDPIYRKRCVMLIDILESRVKELHNILVHAKEQKKANEEAAANTPVFLECVNRDCPSNDLFSLTATRQVIMYGNYDPNKKLTCDECGDELIVERDRGLDDLLHSINIESPA